MIMFDSEKSLEDMVFENTDYFGEILEVYAPEHPENVAGVLRQPKLGAYGTADIVYFCWGPSIDKKKKLYIDLLELKNQKLSHQHVSQCARYRSFFRSLNNLATVECLFRAHLIGLKTFPTDNDLVYLCQSINWLSVYEIDIEPLAGIEFSRVSGWGKRGGENDYIEQFMTLVADDDGLD